MYKTSFSSGHKVVTVTRFPDSLGCVSLVWAFMKRIVWT